VTARAAASLKKRLAAVATPACSITAVTAVGGHASLVCVRGVARPGFEFEGVTVAWAGGGGAAGAATIPSLSSTDPGDVCFVDVEPAFAGVKSLGAGVGEAAAALLGEMEGWA
jgi:hypothetical protein